jgi:hypothetical protein
MTDNHGYETPQKGATEWHESLNRNFRYIDRDIEIRDVDVAKTDYRPKSGAKFLATDTENVYVGDGSQWLRLATSGENPSFDTVSAKTIVDRNSGNGYSVDQLAGGSGGGGVEPAADAIVTLTNETPAYGAYRADGSEIARDSDAGALMNSAINDAASNGGGAVHIGSGAFVSETKVQVQSNVTIRGQGRGNTVFRATAPETGWTSSGSPPTNITIRDLTIDGGLHGNRTGIDLNFAVDSVIQNVAVKNAGGTNSNPGTTPSLRVTKGLRSQIINCHVENSNSVSIEAAIGAEECAIINCSVTKGRREGDAGFLHGISIEKSESCAIIGCTVDSTRGGDGFQPALNANNANDAVVANNRVVGGKGGLYNTNGDCFRNVYIGNTFKHVGDIVKISDGNAGEPHSTLLKGNVFSGGKVEVGATNDVIANNLFYDCELHVRAPTTPPTITNNAGYARSGDSRWVFVEAASNPGVMLFANNHFGRTATARDNTPIYEFDVANGVMTGNVFQTVSGAGSSPSTVSLNDGDRWLVTNNYFRGPTNNDNPALIMCEGRVSENVFEGDKALGTYGSSVAPVVKDNTYFSPKPFIEGNVENYNLTGPRGGTYSGDGMTGRLIKTYSDPEHVIIEDGSGTLYDVHAQFGTGFEYTAPSGELSLADGGFTVGNNGSGADPNASGKAYTFYVR